MPERTVWGNTLGGVFVDRQARRATFALATLVAGYFAMQAARPYAETFWAGGDNRGTGAEAPDGSGGWGSAPKPTTSPYVRPSPTPAASAEQTPSPTLTPSATPTPLPEKSTAKPTPRATGPLRCTIPPESVVYNEAQDLITFTPETEGGKPNPITSYLVFRRSGDPFEEEFEVRKGMHRPVSIEYGDGPLVVYFVHPRSLPEDLRPIDSPHPTISTESLAYFDGQCGTVSKEAATVIQ